MGAGRNPSLDLWLAYCSMDYLLQYVALATALLVELELELYTVPGTCFFLL